MVRNSAILSAAARWLIFFSGLLLGGCAQSPFSSDSCERLCGEVTVRIAGCRESWGVDWQDLGAKKQSNFRSACVQQWKIDRAAMEPREIDLAHTECDDASDELVDLNCEQLRALYL